MDMADNHGESDGRAVINFLKNNIYKLDNATLEAEMKKDFLFAKKKSKDAKKKQSKKKSKTLTRKEKKALGFYDIAKNGVKYNDVLPMNNIWEGYMSELLELDKPVPESNSKGWEQFTQTLFRADFHGSILEVIRNGVDLQDFQVDDWEEMVQDRRPSPSSDAKTHFVSLRQRSNEKNKREEERTTNKNEVGNCR
ncbi:Ribonuclease P protein subunit p29 [Papilio machaon]|uniref:Ribonuclease P protein subunit p29 n=1 Tax=Papilio machaon TaxID=76193 RepID=A0A0N1IDD5_PAPMA|nr:Ribonuclease P protein subunit p29 [Papilio machaon]